MFHIPTQRSIPRQSNRQDIENESFQIYLSNVFLRKIDETWSPNEVWGMDIIITPTTGRHLRAISTGGIHAAQKRM